MTINFKPLAFCIIILAVAACGGLGSLYNFPAGKQDWIPPNFNPGETVLLVSVFDKEEKISDLLKSHYPYRWEFYHPKDSLTKFKDKHLYRYIIVDVGQMLRTGPREYSVVDFLIHDRVERKSYPATGSGSYKGIITFQPVIKRLARGV